MQFEGAAQGDDQQQTTDQTADQGGSDDLPGYRGQTVSLVAAVQAVLLSVTPPRLKDAKIRPTVEVPGLAVVAVFFIRPIWASLLVVAALRGWVAYSCNAFTGKLAVRAARTGLLIAAGGAVPVAVAALAFRVTALVTAAGMLTRKTVTFDLEGWRREKKLRHPLTPIIFFHHYSLDTRHFHHIYRLSRLLYLVGGVEAMSRAVWLRLVQHTHLPPAGLQQHHVSVVVMRQHLQQMLGLLQEAVVDVKRIPRPQLQVHLQHNGFGVLRVQQPGAPELRGSTVVRSEEIR